MEAHLPEVVGNESMMDIDPRLVRRKDEVRAFFKTSANAADAIGISRKTWDRWPKFLEGQRRLKAIMAIMNEQDRYKATLESGRIHAVHGDPTFRGHVTSLSRREPD